MGKLLIIEDEDFIRDLYKRQFEKAGFLVDGYGNGKEGLQAAITNKYDVLLLDIMLPDVNGIEVLRQVKQSAAAKDMPVIMLTNLGQDAIIKEGFKIGATGYLIKASFTPDQVVQEVNNILAQQVLQQPQQQPATPIAAPVVQPTSTPDASTPQPDTTPQPEQK